MATRKSSIDTIDLDVLLSEKVDESVVTTEHPVETGTDPTDHVRVLPIRLTIEAQITNLPIDEGDRLSRGEAPRGATTGYAQRKYTDLLLLKKGRAITVTTPARTYPNMQVTQIARSRDSSLGTDTIQFTVQLKEIVFVNTEEVRLAQVLKPTANPQKPTAKVKQSKQVPTEKSYSSVLKKVTDGGGLTTAGDGAPPRGF